MTQKHCDSDCSGDCWSDGEGRSSADGSKAAFDPGGLTALALEMRDPADVPTFDEWASAPNAELAIVPAHSFNTELEAALAKGGYEPASDWFLKNVRPV